MCDGMDKALKTNPISFHVNSIKTAYDRVEMKKARLLGRRLPIFHRDTNEDTLPAMPAAAMPVAPSHCIISRTASASTFPHPCSPRPPFLQLIMSAGRALAYSTAEIANPYYFPCSDDWADVRTRHCQFATNAVSPHAPL